jgi:HEAT repeat protein
LDDPDWRVRMYAAQCAGKITSVSAANTLHTLLSDAEWWVRYYAAEALFALGETGQKILEVTTSQPDASGRISQMILAEKVQQT